MLFLLCLLALRCNSAFGVEIWDQKDFRDCGYGYDFSPSEPRIPQDLSPERYPWHVAIYRMNHSSGADYLCGGTIIHPRVVITAANCIYEENTGEINNSDLIVATSKTNSSWFHFDKHEKRYKVIMKKLPWVFSGYGRSFNDLIALLALNDTLPVSSHLHPVCMDWTGSSGNDYMDNIGTVFGRSYTEEGDLSDKFVATRLQHYDDKHCGKEVGEDKRFFEVIGKFCGFYLNGSKIERGDSGGGITFPKNTTAGVRHFLGGVLTKEKYSLTNDISFTNVSGYYTRLGLLPIMKSFVKDITGRDVCGRRPLVDYKKPNGEQYTRRDYPWLATIYMERKGKFFGVNCVGSIVHFKAVITSAWCVEDIPILFAPALYRVAVGKHTLNFDVTDQYEQRFNVEKIHLHPSYFRSTEGSENDVAIVIIGGEFAFNDAVLPACIDLDWKPDLYRETPDQGIVVAWDEYECRCQERGRYQYLSNDDCTLAIRSNTKIYGRFEKICGKFMNDNDLKYFVKYSQIKILSKTKVCGKFLTGTKFKDSADLGAGLIFATNSSKNPDDLGGYYIFGIVRNGRSIQNDYNVFTTIHSYQSWISKVLDDIFIKRGKTQVKIFINENNESHLPAV